MHKKAARLIFVQKSWALHVDEIDTKGQFHQTFFLGKNMPVHGIWQKNAPFNFTYQSAQNCETKVAKFILNFRRICALFAKRHSPKIIPQKSWWNRPQESILYEKAMRKMLVKLTPACPTDEWKNEWKVEKLKKNVTSFPC
jgi:hypothetical protein